MVQEEREKCQRQLDVTRELVNTIAAQVSISTFVSCTHLRISTITLSTLKLTCVYFKILKLIFCVKWNKIVYL